MVIWNRALSSEEIANISGGTIPANIAPTAIASAPQNVIDTDDNGSENVTLNGSSSTDSDGSIVSYVWTEGATQIAIGMTPTVSLTVGDHTIILTVTDDDGATATDTIVISVAAPPLMTTTRFEAENATVSGGVTKANNAGFSGTGFVDYVNATGDYVEWTVTASQAGAAELVFGYALSSGNRPLEISVNGVVVSSSLNFPGTGGWTMWGETAVVPLNAGANTVRATAIGSSGGNVDYLDVTTSDTAPAVPPASG